MSRLLIQHYLAELSKLRQVSDSDREGVVSEAFKDLLKGWGRAHDLTFVPQYEIQSPDTSGSSCVSPSPQPSPPTAVGGEGAWFVLH